MDSRSLTNLQTLHPKFRGVAIKAWGEAQQAMPSNVRIIAVQGLRSFQESDELYKIGRTVMGKNAREGHPMGDIVTKAPGGASYHNYGLAFDMAMITNGIDDYAVGPNWLRVVKIMKSYGMKWGGDFPKGIYDAPHFEMTFGHDWHGLLKLHQDGKFIPGTTYVVI